MKCSELWLREWVNPELTTKELSHALTMGGLEVEACTPVSDVFTGVVIGEVVQVDKHPKADRLQVCKVNIGKDRLLDIVCGAQNVKTAMRVALARVNAVLPDQKIILETSIRGQLSEGMLCSAAELHLEEEGHGIVELPQDAPIGCDLWTYLQLDDHILDIAVTPNRGDCLSIHGIAREVMALTQAPMKAVFIPKAKSVIEDKLPLHVEDKASCPRYIGRIIREIKADQTTPRWLKERLRRSGVRLIHPIVDVTNYVMLELGQPMHAFDLHAISNEIRVRRSRLGEKIVLLDGSEKVLDAHTLIIADCEKPLAIAGVMGGLGSSVTLLTQDIFLESAYFSPTVIARARQSYGLHSESAYRFERDVDPTLQQQAMLRASQLILEIVGGKESPMIEAVSEPNLREKVVVTLTRDKLDAVLGVLISDNEVNGIFKRLGFKASAKKRGWIIEIPPHRADITLPEDVIEEIARLYGYNSIKAHPIAAILAVNETASLIYRTFLLRQVLCDLGYHEIVSYSFVDKRLQTLLDPLTAPLQLVNPMSTEMGFMRISLWPGLINTLLYNNSRQQHRVRLFEIGVCFIKVGEEKVQEETRLGGLITGSVYPKQWGVSAREVDFYDMKGDIERIIQLSDANHQLVFKPAKHSALHPGLAAHIYYQDQKIGIMGAVHPLVLQPLDYSGWVFVFELDLEKIRLQGRRSISDVSKFPEIRRDIAFLLNQTVPGQEIQDTIMKVAGEWLKDIFIFDVYQGRGIAPGQKSIALALILQHPTRTLVDDEVTALMERVIATVKGQFGAELRG